MGTELCFVIIIHSEYNVIFRKQLSGIVIEDVPVAYISRVVYRVHQDCPIERISQIKKS